MADANHDAKAIFYQVFECPREERSAFLDKACMGNIELRREVEKLLAFHDGDSSFLHEPVAKRVDEPDTPPVDEKDQPEQDKPSDDSVTIRPTDDSDAPSPQNITQHTEASGRTTRPPPLPGYEIIKELGRGGMGVVYLARQVHADRLVALKFILTDSHASNAERKRFRTEAEAIARLQHSGIIQIFEVGEHEGRQYFSLEYCSQGGLDQYLSGTPVDAREAGELILHLAHAMQVAHQSQIIHRDLKPANVLLASHTGPVTKVPATVSSTADRPSLSSFVAKVTDFGLAKKLDDVTHTKTGLIMGTPSYMSPEQADGKSKVDFPTDIYSLGAILYECLTGRPPFKAASTLDTVLQVTQEEPVCPRDFQPTVPKDLETICLKCLNKEPSRRYASAEALAEDLQRFLEGKPILARPVGWVGHLGRWCRRNPMIASLIATIFLVLVLGVVSTGVALSYAIEQANDASLQAAIANQKKVEAQQQKERAEKNERLAKEELRQKLTLMFNTQLQQAFSLAQQNPIAAQRVLHNYEFCPIHLRNPAWHLCNNLCAAKLNSLVLEGHSVYNAALVFSPDSKILASAGIAINEGGKDALQDIKLWDTSTGKKIATLENNLTGRTTLCFSPDGKSIAVNSIDKRLVQIWDLETKKPKPMRFNGFVVSLAFSEDGSKLSAVRLPMPRRRGFFEAVVWDVTTGKVLNSFRGSYYGFSPEYVELSSDGRFLAAPVQLQDMKKGKKQYGISLWDVTRGKQLGVFSGHEKPVTLITFSRDHQQVVSGTAQTIIVWDVKAKKALVQLQEEGLKRVAFHPNGSVLSAAVKGRKIHHWSIPSGKLIEEIEAHSSSDVQRLVYSQDGRYLASSGFMRNITLWFSASGPDIVLKDKNLVGQSPDGKILIFKTNAGKSLELKDTRTMKLFTTILGHKAPIRSVLMSPDGKLLTSRTSNGVTKIWELPSGQELHTFQGRGRDITPLAFDQKSQTLAARRGTDITLWAMPSGVELASLQGHRGTPLSTAFSPDGKMLASGADDITIKLWRVSDSRLQATLLGHRSPVSHVAFDPQGKKLVGTSDDRKITLWDVEQGQLIDTLEGHERTVSSAVFTQDGSTIISGSTDNTIKVWDVNTRLLQGSIPQSQPIMYLNCDPSGRSLFALFKDGSLKRWKFSPSQTKALFRPTVDLVTSVAFSVDSKVLKAESESPFEGGIQNQTFFWDLESGKRLLNPPQTSFRSDSLTSPDGKLEARIEGRVIRLLHRNQ